MKVAFKQGTAPVGAISPSSVDVDHSTAADGADAEALFREARRRRRIRRLARIGGIFVVIALGLAGYFAVASRNSRHRSSLPTTRTSPKPANGTGALVSPEHPYGLAVAPNGTLYVVDTGRDQILRRLPSGKFRVFAGSGKYGFSGDGGLATHASIEVQTSSGIVVAGNGAVYFSDTGNDRVREIGPNGIITTVAGGGTVPLSTSTTPSLEATFGQIATAPAGLAIGPDGKLYIGAGSVYRLTAEGTLQWVVGEPESIPPPAGWVGVYSNPADEQDFSPAIRLAFDGRGDLLVAGGGGFGVYEKTASGTLDFVENFRGDGYWGSLAESANGTVVLSARNGLSTFDPSGVITPIPADLSAPLGMMTGSGGRSVRAPNGRVLSNTLIGGDGVAVARDDTIYVDTNTGNTFTSVNAIISVSSDGRSTRALWKS